MYSCKEASRIASDALDRRISIIEWTNLRLHLSLCRNCRDFEQNIRIIHKTLERMCEKPSPADSLMDADREIIQSNLKTILRTLRQEKSPLSKHPPSPENPSVRSQDVS